MLLKQVLTWEFGERNMASSSVLAKTEALLSPGDKGAMTVNVGQQPFKLQPPVSRRSWSFGPINQTTNKPWWFHGPNNQKLGTMINHG